MCGNVSRAQLCPLCSARFGGLGKSDGHVLCLVAAHAVTLLTSCTQVVCDKARHQQHLNAGATLTSSGYAFLPRAMPRTDPPLCLPSCVPALPACVPVLHALSLQCAWPQHHSSRGAAAVGAGGARHRRRRGHVRHSPA
jgi:hypothetical protein